MALAPVKHEVTMFGVKKTYVIEQDDAYATDYSACYYDGMLVAELAKAYRDQTQVLIKFRGRHEIHRYVNILHASNGILVIKFSLDPKFVGVGTNWEEDGF